jgi:hypothetical protein
VITSRRPAAMLYLSSRFFRVHSSTSHAFGSRSPALSVIFSLSAALLYSKVPFTVRSLGPLSFVGGPYCSSRCFARSDSVFS